MTKIFPLIFIVLWSSAFITTKPIVDHSEPFSALAFRFFFVSLGFLIFSIYKNFSLVVSKSNLIQSLVSGVLFHGIYLGGVFYSVSVGMPTGIAALIVTLQPILTNILAGPILKEHVSYHQWIGILLGFLGAALVLGFDIGKNNPFDVFKTPKDLEEEALKKNMNPYMLTSFVDGSKTMIEMAALANYLDFNIDTDGMHGPNSTYDELNSIFIPKSSGGILESTNIVDFAFGVAPGVFAIVYSDDDYVNYEMEYLKMGKGPYWTLYRPYHLTSLEIPRTIMKLMVDNETQLSAKKWNVEVVAHSKKDLKAGTNLGSIGGENIYGKAMRVENSKNLAPLGLSENNILNSDVKKGDPIEIKNIDITDNQLYKYWLSQNG